MEDKALLRIAVGFAWSGLMLGCSGSDGGAPPGSAGGAGGSLASAGQSGSTGNVGGLSSVTGGASGTTSGGVGTSGAASGNTAGAVGSGGSGGSGGAGPSGGSGGTPSSGGSGGSPGTAGSTGQSCPGDATFCSGFEDEALPTGAVYKVNAAPGEWTRDFAVDTSVMRGGKSSLRVKSSSDAGTSGSAYQMLAVPAPTGTFWARFYIRQAELDIGGLEHNVFAGASSSDEPNAAGMVEFAEDVGISFNTSDAVRWPANFGRINGATMPYSLAKGAWHCIEISFDSVARTQKLYIDGQLQIDAADYPASVAAPFNFFKFGFNKLHGPARAVWFDDVAVGPTRPGCLP